jgi:hypothetical protein
LVQNATSAPSLPRIAVPTQTRSWLNACILRATLLNVGI